MKVGNLAQFPTAGRPIAGELGWGMVSARQRRQWRRTCACWCREVRVWGMGRLHGLTHIRDCCVQKQTSASAHSTYTHMLASALRRYSLCDCVRPDFNFRTIVCMRVGGGTVAGTTSTTQDCLCGGSKRALLPDMVDVPSGEACHTWRQIQPHASSHTQVRG